MGLKSAFRGAVSFIFRVARRHSHINTSYIWVSIVATAQYADYNHENTLITLGTSILVCLLCSTLPLHEPRLYIDAIATPLVTASPNHKYHTFILHSWLTIYSPVDAQDWRAITLGTCGFQMSVLLVQTMLPSLATFVAPVIYCRHVWFFIVIAAVIAYRSHRKPAAAHGSLPEGTGGIWPAFILHGVSVFTPAIEVQWFTYHLYFYGFCGPERPGPWVLMYGSECVGMEGLLTESAAWLLGYHPTTAHILFLVINVIIHPLRQRLTGTGKLITPVLKAQFWGMLWFLAAHALFTYLKQSVTLTSVKYLGEGPHRWMIWQSIFSDLLGVVYKATLQLSKPWYRNLRRRWSNSDTGQPPNQSPDPEPFSHAAIATPNTIRILCIHPSLNNKAPIHCDLLTGSFFPTDPYKVYTGPKYTGISYVWDQPATSKLTIYIGSSSCPYQVQPTVYAILRAMRNPLSPQHVWIDSICINQDDDAEKATQVQLMRLIYENADHVIGWLTGPSNPDPGSRLETTWRDLRDFFSLSDTATPSTEYRAREMLGRINSTMYLQQDFDLTSTLYKFRKGGSSSRADNSTGDILHHLPGTARDWTALTTLLTNPYFTRVWIIQEIVVASSITLHYGGQIIPWDLFARSITILSSYGLPFKLLAYMQANDYKSIKPIPLPGISNGMVLENLRRWYERPGWLTSPPVGSTGGMLSLEDTLKLCTRFESTWAVDRIFALLGVARDVELLGVRGLVDYREDKETDVFVGVAKRLMAKKLLRIDVPGDGRGGNVFSVLRFAGVGRVGVAAGGDKGVDDREWKGKVKEKAGNAKQRIEGLPSWVPDWTQDLIDTAVLSHDNAQYNYCASSGRECKKDKVKFAGSKILLPGMLLGRIRWVSPVFTAHNSEPGTKRQFLNALGTVVIHVGLRTESLVYSHTPAESEPQSLVEAYWRTIFGDMGADARPANSEFIQVWAQIITCHELAPEPDPDNPDGGNGSVFGIATGREHVDDKEQKKKCLKDSTAGRIWLQLGSNPDNLFNHILMTELSNANSKHRGGFTDILGARKSGKSPLQHPIFALGRRLCLTVDGHMGLVPAGTAAGDRITVFEGAPTPHVIRPVFDRAKEGGIGNPRRTSVFQLVGECYVHGVMDGEAIKEDTEFKTVILV